MRSAIETLVKERFPDADFIVPRMMGRGDIFKPAMVPAKLGRLMRLWLWITHLGRFEPLATSDFQEAPFRIKTGDGKEIRGNIIIPTEYFLGYQRQNAVAAALDMKLKHERERVDKLLAQHSTD